MWPKFRLSLMFLLASAMCTPLPSETRYVSNTGSGEPPYTAPDTAATSIQAALDESFAGDIILVDAGDYEETVIIRRDRIALVGAGKHRSRIIAPEGEDAVGVLGQGDLLRIRGFAVLGGQVGISLSDTRALIADCLLEGARESSLRIAGWAAVNVVDTVFAATPWGIELRGADYYSHGEPELFASGCLFDRTQRGISVDGRSTIIAAGCTFFRNKEGILLGYVSNAAADAILDSCTFVEGSYGIFSMSCSGVIDVSRSVFALNGGDAILTDQTALITDSLFYANEGVARGYDDTPNLAFHRCTFASNRVALKVAPALARDCIFWNNGEDVVWDGDQAWPDTRVIDHSLINDPAFGGENGNISGNPEFIGWGPFNDTDSPIHVDASAPPSGDGSADSPFASPQEALLSFDLRLSEGSVCLGAGSLGGDIGYAAGIAPSGTPRSDRVAIEMAPGGYGPGWLVVPPQVRIYGARGASGRPSIDAEQVVVPEDARLEGLDFEHSSVKVYGGELWDCEFDRTHLSLHGGLAASCKVLSARTYLEYTPARMANCLLTGTPGFAAIGINPAENPHELLNCTITGGDAAIRVSAPSEGPCAQLTNCIVAGQVTGPTECLHANHSLFAEGWPGEGNLAGNPMFASSDRGDFRLKPRSRCIDAGNNSAPGLPDTDIAGMHRIMYGRNSLTVDMGAYEYYINEVKPGPTPQDATVRWSSAADRTYSVFYSDDLLTWFLTDDSVSSAGNTTTSWIDDGSKTGIAPSLAPRRFYRILENP